MDRKIHRGLTDLRSASMETSRKINDHILKETDKGIRRWIDLSLDQKQKALKRALDIREGQITELKVTEALLHEFVEEALKCLTLIKRGDCWCDHAANKFSECKCQPVKDFMLALQSVPPAPVNNPVEVEEDPAT